MATIQRMSLNAPVFTPTTIQFAQYTPQQEDFSLLANSLARREERQRTAAEKVSAMDLAFSQMRSKLHQDEETMKWFTDWSNNYKNQVNSYVQLGDYGNAIKAATILGGEAANNAELQARIASNIDYENWAANINKLADSGSIDEVTRDRLIATNKYKFTPIVSDGVTIGGKKWTEAGGAGGGAVETPVQKVPLTALLATADKLYKERVSGGSSTTFRDAAGNVTSYYDAGVAGAESRDYQTQWKDAAVLQKIFDEVVDQDPNAGAYIEQMYKDAVWELQVKSNELLNTPIEDVAKRQALQSRVNQLENQVKNNTGYVSLPEFLHNMTKDSINKGLAYRNTISKQDAAPYRGTTKNGSITGLTDESQNEEHTRVNASGGVGNVRQSRIEGDARQKAFIFLQDKE